MSTASFHSLTQNGRQVTELGPVPLNQLLSQETGRLRAYYTATQTLLQLSARQTTPQEYLQGVVEFLQSLVGCECVGIRVRNDRGEFPYEASVGFSEDHLRREYLLPADHNRCVCVQELCPDVKLGARCSTPSGSFHCPQLQSEPAYLDSAERAMYRVYCGSGEFASVAVIPVRRDDPNVAVVHLADRRPGHLRRLAVEFIESIVPLLGETLNRFMVERVLEQRASQLHDMASELTKAEHRERRRLAQVLHDGIQQLQVAAKWQVTHLMGRIKDADAARALTSVGEMLAEAIKATKSLSIDLCPPILYEAGLQPALVSLAQQMQSTYGLLVRIEADADIEPGTEDDFLYRAVRELLFNVVKHAQTTEARVRLSSLPGHVLRLEVTDRGTGFGPPSGSRKGVVGSGSGFGLYSIRERLQLLGGRLDIHSLEGQGTRAILVVCNPPITNSGASLRADQGAHSPSQHGSHATVNGVSSCDGITISSITAPRRMK